MTHHYSREEEEFALDCQADDRRIESAVAKLPAPTHGALEERDGFRFIAAHLKDDNGWYLCWEKAAKSWVGTGTTFGRWPSEMKP